MTSLLVHYSGHVQGVGFRYTVKQLAAGFEVTGDVSNLSDGRVELHAQGEEEEVRAFLEAIREKMRHYIHEEKQALVPRDPNATRFVIGH